MKNQECKVRPKIINSALYYSFSIKVNKCSRNCNSINDPYFKECVPDIIKYINLKVIDMISFRNETMIVKKILMKMLWLKIKLSQFLDAIKVNS